MHVLVNGVSQFSGIVNGYIGGAPGKPVDPIGPAPTQFWRQIVSLTAGDLVEFAVGDGENDSYQVDSTGVTAIIAAVPEPTTSLMIGILGVALACCRVRFS